MTKYLYAVLRYLLYRKRHRFQEYEMQLSKYNGSDFSMNQTILPEHIYSRWITAQFITYNYWHNEPLFQCTAINPDVGGNGPVAPITFPFLPISYTASTGVVKVSDRVDLEHIQPGDIWFDSAGQPNEIIGGISNIKCAKQFQISTTGIPASLGTAPTTIKRMYGLVVQAGAGVPSLSGQIPTWESEN